MKEITKRIVALLFALVLLFSCCYPAAAAENIEVDLPVVHVLGRLKAIYNKEGKAIYPFKTALTDMVMADSDAIVDSVAKSMLLGNWSYLGNEISKNLSPAFSELVLDGNGEISNGTYTTPYTVPRPIKNNYQINDYLFNYDWRLDPITLANDLSDFIDNVLAVTGKSKVHLVSRCLGTSIAASYLTFYGSEKIETCVMYAGSAMGILPISTFFSGSLNIDPDALKRYADNATGDSDYVDLMKTFANILKASKLTSAIFKENFSTAIKQILPDLLLETYATMPSHWSMVSDEYYEKAKTFVFSGREEEYSGLISKIDNYHYNVQVVLPETLKKLKAEGLKIAIFAKYNFELAPIYENSTFQSDNTIELSSMSFGATAPIYGQELSDSYIAKVNASGKGKYISPDHIIDASTCLFPDNTWFIKDAGHETWPTSVYNFILKICQTKKEYTVTTNKSFPQFLQYNNANQSLSVVTRYPTLQTEKLENENLVYTGKKQQPKAVIVDISGKALKENTDYTLTYSRGCTEIGKYFVNINYKGGYKLSPKTLYFNILPDNVKLSGKKADGSDVLLSWDSVNKATGYAIYKYNTATKAYEKIDTTTENYYVVDGLKNLSDYTFAVKAYTKVLDNYYYSPDYKTVKIQTGLQSPTISLKASTKCATVSWKAVQGANNYEIYMASENGSYKKIATTAKTSYVKTGLKSGKTYYFKAVAVATVNGKQVKSDYSDVKKLKATNKPAKPQISLSSSARTITVSWNKVPGAKGYTVYMATSKNGTYKKLGTTQKTYFTKKSLKSGKRYYFKVNAYSKIDDETYKSSFSSKKSVKATNKPQKPVITLKASEGAITVSWNKISGAKGYTVYMATSKDGAYKKIKTTSGTSYTKSGLNKGTNYYFKVRAYSKFDGNTYTSDFSTVKNQATK